jgi:large subunit ribosomal protein L7/L12
MPTAAKVAAVAELTEKLERSRASILLHYRELNVKELTELRKRVRGNDGGVEVKVAKNTLLRLATTKSGKPGLEHLFTGPTAIAFIYGSEPQGAKAVLDAVRALRKENVVVTGGIIGQIGLDPAGVERLTTMEPREQQLSKLLGAMQASASNLAATLSGAAQELLFTLMALRDKLEGQPQEGAGSTLSAETAIESVGSLSIREAVALAKAIQERFGVTPAAPTAVAAPAEGGPAAPVEAAPVEEPTEFTATLTEVGPNKINVIKAVRELVPGLGLKEAKELVDTAPKPVKESVSKEEADAVKAKLAEVGATVEITAVG